MTIYSDLGPYSSTEIVLVEVIKEVHGVKPQGHFSPSDVSQVFRSSGLPPTMQ